MEGRDFPSAIIKKTNFILILEAAEAKSLLIKAAEGHHIQTIPGAFQWPLTARPAGVRQRQKQDRKKTTSIDFFVMGLSSTNQQVLGEQGSY